VAEKKRKQLHQSGLEMYDVCGTRFYYRYIAGIKRPPSSYLVRGSACDTGANADLDNKIVTNELLERDVVLDITRDAVQKHKEVANMVPDDDETGLSHADLVGQITDTAVRLVGAYHDEAAPKMKPFKTQSEFSIKLDKFLRARADSIYTEAENKAGWMKRTMNAQARALNAAARDGWDLVGTRDLIEGTAVDVSNGRFLNTNQPFTIRDLKSSKKSPTQRKEENGKIVSLGTADESEQLTIYALASKVIDGRLPDSVALDYIVDLKRGPEYRPVFSTRTEQDVDVALNRIANAIANIQLGSFVPISQTHWQCSSSYCGYTSICPYFKQAKSVTVPSSLEGTANYTSPPLIQIQAGETK
jgi:hypothetical protein